MNIDSHNQSPIFKRKFRWVVELFKGEEVLLPPTFAKVAARPQLEGNDITLTFFDYNRTDWSFLEEITAENNCKCILGLHDGCGMLLETWTLKNVTVQDANFVEYSESLTEPVDLELFLNYTESVYKAEPFPYSLPPSCTVVPSTPPCTCECHKVTCNCSCSKPKRIMGIGLLGDTNIIF